MREVAIVSRLLGNSKCVFQVAPLPVLMRLPAIDQDANILNALLLKREGENERKVIKVSRSSTAALHCGTVYFPYELEALRQRFSFDSCLFSLFLLSPTKRNSTLTQTFSLVSDIDKLFAL